jgi:hypothetical protein
MNIMDYPDWRLFPVRRDPGERPPAPELTIPLNPINPFDVWRRGHATPHNVDNIARACRHYQEVVPKYKIIHRRLQSERLNALNLRKLIREHRRVARKRTVTRSLLGVHVSNKSALKDAMWSIAALQREEEAFSDFLEALCRFIGVEDYDFVNDEFENNEFENNE